MRKLLFAATLSLAACAGCSKAASSSAADQPAPAPTGDKLASASEPDEAEEANLPTMTVDEVDQALAANKAKAVDCNSDRSRKKTGVVPGAILVSDDASYAASELPADKATKLVFYCANSG